MIWYPKEDIPDGIKAYEKFCRYDACQKTFWSDSRNQKYCCQECADKANKKIVIRNKRRKVKRVEYDKNRDINRALSSAYQLAHKVSDLYKIPKKCNCASHGFTDKCSGELELHHCNGNPFDNSPNNLEYECARHHKMCHDKVGDINMVDTYNEAVHVVEDLIV